MLYSLLYNLNCYLMENEHTTHHHAPQKKDDVSIPLAIVLAGLLIAGAIFFSNKNNPSSAAPIQANAKVAVDNTQAPLTELALKENDHVLGNPNAEVLIIEYSDTECPFCKNFHASMAEIMNESGKTGSVAWVYRHFPLDMHPKARKEGEALECANELGGNNAFWAYANKIFEITPSNNGLNLSLLPQIATDVGLDATKFTACLDSGKFADRVQSDFVSGVNIGIHGTPYTVVWNRKTGKQMPISGALPINNIRAILKIVVDSQPTPKT